MTEPITTNAIGEPDLTLAPEIEVGARRHHVVIIGAGFGGLFAARALKHAPVSVTVIDRTNHHLFQPLLYQVATGILSEGDIAPPIRDVLRKYRNTEVLIGDVTAADLDQRVLTVVNLGETLQVGYDSLIVAAGAGQSYFGHPDFSRYAPGMKSIDDALEIRGRIFGAFEMAERESSPDKRREWLTFVVIGGGPTGVEMAGQIAELSHRSLHRNFRHFDPASARVVLLDAGDALIPSFGKRLSGKALSGLRKLGVEVHLNTMVTNVDRDGVEAKAPDGSVMRIEAQTKIWAAGVEASTLGKMFGDQSGAETDRSGRDKVNPDLTLPGRPEVFVIGDMINLNDLPGVAEVAMQGGIHAAHAIKRRVESGDPNTPVKPFHYRNLGEMATISRFQAVASFGPFRVAGFLGWLIWLFVHLAFLTGFKNRVATVFNWFIAFIGRGRPQRTITHQQVLARTVMQQQERE